MKKFQQLKRSQGFTLIELVIAVVVIGFMALVMTKQFGSNVTYGASAQTLYTSARKLGDNWMAITTSAGVPTTISSTSLAGTGYNALDILIGGKSYMASAMQFHWDKSGIRAMADLAEGASGSYTVGGYTISLSGGGTSPVSVVYSTVPDAIVLQLVRKYGSGVSSLATSDTTDPSIQYGTATGGNRSLTILYRL
jgi:prepilin-type N-terminal cleavage/methylation domain-containing protein